MREKEAEQTELLLLEGSSRCGKARVGGRGAQQPCVSPSKFRLVTHSLLGDRFLNRWTDLVSNDVLFFFFFFTDAFSAFFSLLKLKYLTYIKNSDNTE